MWSVRSMPGRQGVVRGGAEVNSPQSGKESFSQSANLIDRIGGMGEESIPVFGFRQPSF